MSGGPIIIKNGEPVTTTLAIAEGTGSSHESTIKLARKYLADLKMFGPVGFEIQQGRPLPQGGFAQSTEYAMLNERQSSVLIAYMRNSDKVRDFKMALVKGFFEMRAALTAAPDPLASLPPEHRALVALMCENATIRARQDELAATQVAMQQGIARIEANQVAAIASVQSFTALGYSIFREIPMSKIELTRLGRKASMISKKRGIAIDQVSDSRFGRVGCYHISALDAALEEISK
ncbi:Rha family transcriptional regulator [Massilia sp. RP-1-19]|uniref:Rha family transcriptional regulator n=1 Tax=Massilia polaris TaxID=2728846 RepID=A0A848HPS2_9BURK|nr:Rha family transcriptional regulator [Massilia polaris]NML61801.1 Rha family transcriptional regulator [Massilia polaris]